MKREKPISVADWLDKAFGRIVAAGAIVGYAIATQGRLVLELVAALAVVLAVRLIRKWRWRCGRKERAAELERIKARFGGLRMKKTRKKKGKLKHYEPNLMPLELRKAVRTGDPIPKADFRVTVCGNRHGVTRKHPGMDAKVK